MGRFQLGVVDVVWRKLGLAPLEVSQRAAEAGFEFIDLTQPTDDPLALPVVDRMSPVPRAGYTTVAIREGDSRTYDDMVAAFRAAPGSRIEPGGFCTINTCAMVKQFLADVPDVGLLLDTGHVTFWGEDPFELIPYAEHIQLRQARKGVNQALEGDIDFAAFLDALEQHGYKGGLSIEYFDIPELGYPLDDPIGHALALAAQVRALL